MKTEQEVEVAAYATLGADSRSRTVPAVVLEANMCPVGCGASIKSENHLREHLEKVHSTPIGKQLKLFPNMGKFLAWKEARERESSRRYVVREKRQGWRRFACSRSGQPSGTDRPQRWKRTGNFCPAFIRSSTRRDGSVKVRFWLFHTCKQPDNTPLPSERELAKANEQLELLERAIVGIPTRRRGRKPANGDAGPGAGLEPPGQEAETAEAAGEERRPLDEPQRTGTSPSQQKSRRVAAPRLLSAAPRAVSGDAADPSVKHRVRTNLLRLHSKLERASAEEARQMLADTEELLERYTRLRQRGTKVDAVVPGPDEVEVEGEVEVERQWPGEPVSGSVTGTGRRAWSNTGLVVGVAGWREQRGWTVEWMERREKRLRQRKGRWIPEEKWLGWKRN
ncbi:hypothetical protein FJT64_024401 [Amphibalanus amphitrite]|uniref:C2H2-type domain-containing protein n=1 Tax=Amphibalanus amphitrite TaxID=1232801 RepID=A0A6A4WP06_AMPAM|nr:hypothetical protein FJT64_024401 [Amphibalanus amphitrite]